MDLNALVSLIGTLGFPIACCMAMAWYVKYITDKHRDQLDQLNKQHGDEMKQVTSALNNNTIAIQHLSDVLSAQKEGE